MKHTSLLLCLLTHFLIQTEPIEQIPLNVINIADDIASLIIASKSEQTPEQKKDLAIQLIAHVTALSTEITKIILEKKKPKKRSLESSDDLSDQILADEIGKELALVQLYITQKIEMFL